MFGSLVFLNPLILIALLLLGVFWLILSALPPEPILQKFPPIRYLRGLQEQTAVPQKIPLWLRILRILMVACLILALAAPVLVPSSQTNYQRPVLLVIDDGWANAANWRQIKSSAKAIIEAADMDKQQIALLFTTATQQPKNIVFQQKNQLLEQLQTHEPQPFAPDHAAIIQNLLNAQQQGSLKEKMQIIWLSDGNDYGFAGQLVEQLSQMGELQILNDSQQNHLMITALDTQASGVLVSISGRLPSTNAVIAQDKNGNILARTEFEITADKPNTQAQIKLPLELRNKMGAVRIEGVSSAAAVNLLDSSWVKPRIGIIGGPGKSNDQSLLLERFYLEKALRPFAEVSSINAIETAPNLPKIIILLDTGKLSDLAYLTLSDYVNNGGLLIRFAGPRLAERQDDLIPVPLRTGGRLLGSALGWEQPQQLSAFADTSPFFGLDHTGEINVIMQVLADSSPGLADHVWARLGDGTPLVTSATRENGRIVLFHVTASADWSQLPLSGIFVQMLKRILPLAERQNSEINNQANSSVSLDLTIALNAKGALTAPKGDHQILTLSDEAMPISRQYPAGLWSNASFSMARNVVDNLDISKFPNVGQEVKLGEMKVNSPLAFSGYLLALAIILLIIDSLIILFLSGKLPKITKSKPSALTVLLLVLMASIFLTPTNVMAETLDPFASIGQTRLAYVVTNNSAVDRFSHAGLKGLSRELYLRTTVEPAEPLPINLETDDLNVILFLYWPLLAEVELSDKAAAKLNTYLKNGGMLVIDTQDAGLRALGAGGTDPVLSSLFAKIDIPRLRQIPKDHVLTKAYYLIESFPGRYANAPVWVEADRKGSSLDGVSSLVIGGNDWVAAWAIDAAGQPLAGVSADIDNQREMAKRFGINLVMYVLAGNYKADQVHIPILLERLQQ